MALLRAVKGRGLKLAATGLACVLAALVFGTGSDSFRPTAHSAGDCTGAGDACARSLARQHVFYVAPHGSDGNPGTKQHPWRSLQRAADRLGPGDRLVVRGGTYDEWVVIRRSGKPGARVTVAAYPGERPVLRGRLRVTGDYVAVRGFVFSGGTSANATEVLVYVDGADHFRLSDSELTGSAMSAIFLGDGADDARIVRNWIHGNGTHENYDHGIYWARGRSGLIANNVIEGNMAFGIQLYPDADGIVVANNTIAGNGRSGVIVGGEGNRASDGVTIANNILVGNAEFGVRSYWGARIGQGNVVRSNLAFANAAGDLPDGFFGEGFEYRDNLVSDPRFVASGEWRLRGDSPAVDRALTDYAPPKDLTGKRRDARPDLGALER